MTDLEYDNAEYMDRDTGLDKELVFKSLFVADEPGFNASIREELASLASEIDLPETIRITTVKAVEISDSKVDFVVYTPDLSTGTQTSRGRHPLLVLRSDEYAHYRVGIKPE